MDGLPNFLTHGAPLARFARRSSAIKFESEEISITGDYCSKNDSKEEDRGKVWSFALREDEAIWKAIHCQQDEAKRIYSGFVTFVIIYHHYHCSSFSFVWKTGVSFKLVLYYFCIHKVHGAMLWRLCILRQDIGGVDPWY